MTSRRTFIRKAAAGSILAPFLSLQETRANDIASLATEQTDDGYWKAVRSQF